MKKRTPKKKIEDSKVNILVDLERGCYFCIHHDMCHTRITVDNILWETRQIQRELLHFSADALLTNMNTIRTCLGNACYKFDRNKSIQYYNIDNLI